ncbi:MAG: efflux RND transporter permease subunit [Myxococcales bacterium]
MNFVAASQRRAVAIFLLVGVLAGAGVLVALQMPSSIFPSVTFPLVKVMVDVGQEPSAQVMPAVTRPLEEAILRVPGVVLVRSITSRGSAEIAAQFSWGTDMQVSLQRVEAEAQRVRPDLPPQARITVRWMNPAVFPMQGYALTSDTRTQAELLEIAEYTLKPALIRIPGVAEVQVLGGRRREFQIQLDQAALDARHLAAADVVAAIRKGGQVISAGLVEGNHELYLALVDGRPHSLDDLGAMTVPVPNGVPAALTALGKLVTADQVTYIRTRADGKEAVLVNLIRQPSANTVAIANGVDHLFRARTGLLPADVHWGNFYDQAAFVSASIAGVRDAILIGVALASLVLFAFLRSVRLTLVAAVAIPLCVAIVALGLSALGQTINLMTLAGVAAALGLIADDAIVVIENIVRHREQKVSADPAESGLREMLPALLGSSVSTIVIFLPFAALTGVVGAFFKPLALTMGLTLGVSFCVAAFAVPVAVRLIGAGPPRRAPGSFSRAAGKLAGKLGVGYRAVLRVMLDHGAVPALVVALLVGTAFLLYRSAGTDFLPRMDEGSIILDYWTPAGTSLSDTDRMLVEAETVISSLPDVESWSRRTGAQLGFSLTEANKGDYVIKLKPLARRRPVDEVINALRSGIAGREPAIHTDFGQLIEDNIGDLSGGTPQPIDVKLFGDDPTVLQQKAREVAAAIATVPGVEDVFSGVVIAGPALAITPDPAAARFGLSTETLQAAVEPAIQGTVAGQLLVHDRLYDMRVLARTALPLAQMPVRTPSGALVPLGTVARVSTGAPEAEIQRDHLKTFVGVTARLNGRSLGAAMADIQVKVDATLRASSGVTVQYGGTYEQQQQSFRSLFYILTGGLLLVGVVVLFEFADFRAPIVTALVSLATLAGVLAALKVTGMTLNISSYVGAIMMAGIVGENAIFVIHEARLALREGKGVREAWEAASLGRARPVAMTILATALALGPLALALGAGSQLMQPLAIAVIGGFLLSGPAVLLLLPGLYRLLDPRGRLGA